MTVQCDNCGSSLAKVIDLPDCVRLECPDCGHVGKILKKPARGRVKLLWREDVAEDDEPVAV